MELFTKEQYDQLLANGRASAESEGGIDHKPVVKIFTPDADATWLLSEIVPHDPDIAFGLCDLGLGSPEMGYVSLTELRNLRGMLKLPVERDLHFKAVGTLTQYAKAASLVGRIVEPAFFLPDGGQS